MGQHVVSLGQVDTWSGQVMSSLSAGFSLIGSKRVTGSCDAVPAWLPTHMRCLRSHLVFAGQQCWPSEQHTAWSIFTQLSIYTCVMEHLETDTRVFFAIAFQKECPHVHVHLARKVRLHFRLELTFWRGQQEKPPAPVLQHVLPAGHENFLSGQMTSSVLLTSLLIVLSVLLTSSG